MFRWRTLTTPSAREPEDMLPPVGLHGGSGIATALRKPRHTCIRDWLRFSTIIGPKLALLSARQLQSLGTLTETPATDLGDEPGAIMQRLIRRELPSRYHADGLSADAK